MRWFMASLRRRLLLWLLPATFLAGVLASLGTYWGATSQLSELLNDQMRYIAEHITVESNGAVSFSDARSKSKSHFDADAADEVVLQVWHNGKLDYTTDPAQVFPEPKQTGLHNIYVGGQVWHSYVSKRGERWILVAQAKDARWEALAVVAVHLFWPVVSLLPLLALFIWFGIGYGLKPLRKMSVELAQRNVNSMDPIDTQSLPSEVMPFANALNDLLQRLEQAISMQQDFVADAAHELRTPVMGLLIQTQLAQRAASEEERQNTLQQIQLGIDRLSHLSKQLLALARLDPHPDGNTTQAVELSALCKSVITDHIRVAEAKQIDLGLTEHETASIQGDPDNLRILLNNLVDNAIRYTESGGHVDLSVRRVSNGILLEVCDDGPGIPEAERARVLERFYRGSNANASGSGLGLSIVKRIADRHAAVITLDTGLHGRGLKVQVCFPQAALPLIPPVTETGSESDA